MDKKVAHEWELCPCCKNDGTAMCMGCTQFYGTAPAVIICGIPCGTSAIYYHKNFEQKAVKETAL